MELGSCTTAAKSSASACERSFGALIGVNPAGFAEMVPGTQITRHRPTFSPTLGRSAPSFSSGLDRMRQQFFINGSSTF